MIMATDNMQKSMRLSVVIPVTALVGLILIGAFFINVYINTERERDLQQWEARLGLVADAKIDAVQNFLSETFDDLQVLADNASLQLYLGELLQARASGSSQPAEFTYLRNLILASANRYGYWSDDTPRIAANIVTTSISGLALLDIDLHPVVATPGMPAVGEQMTEPLRRVLSGVERQATGLVPDGQEQAVIIFAVPVMAVMGSHPEGGDTPIGLLVGVRNAEQELFPLVKGGVGFAEDSEALLLEMRGDRVVYLSSTKDGAKPMRRSMPVSRAKLAAAQAVKTLDNFALLDNYRGESVLQVSRRVNRQTWVLAQQVDAVQALSESNERRQFLLISLSLLLLASAAIVVAAWRHGSSVRARHQADELIEKAARLQRQTELLHATTDNIDVLTLLISQTQEVIFTNQATADAVDSKISDIVDNELTAVLGPATVGELQGSIRQAQQSSERVYRVMALRFGAHDRVYHASFIPVERIGHHRNLMLLVFRDITDFQRAQQRHTKLLRNLVATLVNIVDLHDPYTAFHSQHLAEVAGAIGREMGLNSNDLEMLDLAAMLANVGKIAIPRELLTKTGSLVQDDEELLHSHVSTALELLGKLDFDGPVLEILAQKQEHLDGSGYPRQLSAEQMTLPGKILSVANAFVALVSPRAFRQAISVSDAVDRLMQDADKLYDRHVLAALFHITENLQVSWSQWNEEQSLD
ncbi:MAG: HD domain-containing phosphohydrolase [Gammaproteobacteria bacterium]|nr:HD domain-containing phosphohydrolase [Gammaproteobacteria bacterium]